MSSKDSHNRYSGLFVILLKFLLLLSGLASWMYVTHFNFHLLWEDLQHCVAQEPFKHSSNIELKKRFIPGKTLEYFLPSYEEFSESEKSFEQEVLSEVRRVCTEIYPDLDPDYVSAIIWLESRFEPDAVNKKTGATGLMQILPKWHSSRADSLGVSLDNWKGNILVGCDILNEVLQLKGSMSYAVNFYAGGYPYADYYERTSQQSPYEKLVNEIISNGTIEYLKGGDANATSKDGK